MARRRSKRGERMRREQMVLEERTGTSRGGGARTVEYKTVYVAWVGVQPLSASAILQFQQTGTAVTHRLIMANERYRPTDKNRFVYTDRDGSTRYFYVEGATDIGFRRREWEILAREGA